MSPSQDLAQCSQKLGTTLHDHSSCDHFEDAPLSKIFLFLVELHGVCSIIHKYSPSRNVSTPRSCLVSSTAISPPQLDGYLGTVSTPRLGLHRQNSNLPLPSYSISPILTLSSSIPASSNAFVVPTSMGMQVWPTANIATASCRRERKRILRSFLFYIRDVSNDQVIKQK